VLTVHGDGEQTRDYTFVEDAVEATALVVAAPQAVGDVFNIGTGVETSVNTLAQEILALSGGASRIEHLDRRDIDNIRRRALSPEKIRVRLGWQPRVRLREGLKATAAAQRAATAHARTAGPAAAGAVGAASGAGIGRGRQTS
jgi:UDP-glucose 4-epimerase